MQNKSNFDYLGSWIEFYSERHEANCGAKTVLDLDLGHTEQRRPNEGKQYQAELSKYRNELTLSEDYLSDRTLGRRESRNAKAAIL